MPNELLLLLTSFQTLQAQKLSSFTTPISSSSSSLLDQKKKIKIRKNILKMTATIKEEMIPVVLVGSKIGIDTSNSTLAGGGTAAFNDSFLFRRSRHHQQQQQASAVSAVSRSQHNLRHRSSSSRFNLAAAAAELYAATCRGISVTNVAAAAAAAVVVSTVSSTNDNQQPQRQQGQLQQQQQHQQPNQLLHQNKSEPNTSMTTARAAEITTTTTTTASPTTNSITIADICNDRDHHLVVVPTSQQQQVSTDNEKMANNCRHDRRRRSCPSTSAISCQSSSPLFSEAENDSIVMIEYNSSVTNTNLFETNANSYEANFTTQKATKSDDCCLLDNAEEKEEEEEETKKVEEEEYTITCMESSASCHTNMTDEDEHCYTSCSTSSLESIISSFSASNGFGGEPSSPPPTLLTLFSNDSCNSSSSSSSSSSTLSSLSSSSSTGVSSPTSAKASPWRKVRSLVTSPFIQTYKRQKYPWIQLAGHQGNFLAGKMQGTILKKRSGNEDKCFQAIMQDELRDFVPSFKNLISMNGDSYLELEDLLAKFNNPSIMDIKMGVRTYLEEELIKAGEKPKLRKDMYEKMVAIDPDEPKADEHALRAVTKPRYMIWRESISSTSTLGFRIDGVKLRGAPNATDASKMTKDFKRTKTEESVRAAVMQFAEHNRKFIEQYRQRLLAIRQTLIRSNFFASHEMIGSSLLLVHDDTHADIWLIDFAKTCPLPDGIRITHNDTWQIGNHEDGYLTGLDNLIRMFGDMHTTLCDRVDDQSSIDVDDQHQQLQRQQQSSIKSGISLTTATTPTTTATITHSASSTNSSIVSL